MNRKAQLSAYFIIAAAAFGLISDGYQGGSMTVINVVYRKLYPVEYTTAVATRVSNAFLVGEVIGQILIGLVCDRIGRKAALVLTTLLVVVGATLATAAHGAYGSIDGMLWCVTIARGISGVGVGGEYPAGSTSAGEAANEKMPRNRGPVFIMVTNLVLSLGGILAVCVFLIVLSAAGETHPETIWRTCFGIGIILPLTVFYFRMHMLSTQLFRESAIKRRVPYWLALKRYWRSLVGTCGAWFLYDFVSAPNGLFSGAIISSAIHDGSIRRIVEWQLLLGALAVPGVFLGAALCNVLGRRNTMMIGFSGYLVFGLAIALSYNDIIKTLPLFVVLYGLMQSSGNLGPGDMLGLVSTESYPTAIRGTFYGLSAAIGKTGAAIGTQVFTPIENNLGMRWTFIIAAIVGVVGVLVTYFFVPDMTSIDLMDEDASWLCYLRENGWGGEVGDDGDSGDKTCITRRG
ncbi:MFS Git1p glycerophosphoinositol permease [Fomitopsis schrenkii]|uniref:MFS Git1p glycerophosphoinositol permease n=1 Tax=Fomitopsis schrenkii TaxID=2126942 RepID=S8DSG0_FOMSC|nr:MFS Git1p glycerophosphoinositol permease [Fomitopsis schrenkii]